MGHGAHVSFRREEAVGRKFMKRLRLLEKQQEEKVVKVQKE